ncbi:hypothetical protein [Synechococcus sp. PCC 7336]|uniref:hypothetical protein n=1 Tax=Synechococcus sp. PCC 7336 TaxID=195250 RepID=UPI00034AB9AC|nr:hypothetical protein [Synechococcus sp. PCC 7336]
MSTLKEDAIFVAAVSKYVNRILKHYPICPYQEAFTNPSLRQQLLDYITNRVSESDVLLDEIQQWMYGYSEVRGRSRDRSFDFDELIYRGVHQICQDNSIRDTHMFHAEDFSNGDTPSNWFG